MGAGHLTISWGVLMGFVNFTFVPDLGVPVDVGPLQGNGDSDVIMFRFVTHLFLYQSDD